MKELGRVMFSTLIVLSVLALVLASGCTDSGVAQTGVPGATLIGHDEQMVSGVDSETGRMETVKIVVDVYGDKDLTTTTEMRYGAISGQKMTGFAVITHRGIAFAFGVKNTGSVDIQIVGAKIKDSQNVQNYDYVSEADYPRGVKTIGPGETTGVYWTFPSEIDGDTRFVVEIKTLKESSAAKAQVAAQPETETEVKATSQPIVTTTGPTPTQVAEIWYSALFAGDFEVVKQNTLYSGRIKDADIQKTKDALVGKGVKRVEFGVERVGKDGQSVFLEIHYMDKNGNILHTETGGFLKIENEWKKDSVGY